MNELIQTFNFGINEVRTAIKDNGDIYIFALLMSQMLLKLVVPQTFYRYKRISVKTKPLKIVEH